MPPTKKFISFRYFYNHNLLKRFLVLIPVVALLILLISCLKQSTFIVHRSPKKFRISPKVYRNASTFPFVKEFSLSSKIRKFYNENARTVGFTSNNITSAGSMNSSTKIIYLATPYFSEWNPRHFYFLHFGNVTFTRYSCAVSNCYATKNPSDIYKADAVLFHIRDLEVFSIPQHRSPNQIWILYSMEPPWLEVKDMRRFNGLFNWTMSYRRNSDILMKYGFIGRKKQVDADIPKLLPSSNVFQRKMDRAVWYVSNCNTDSNREEYVQRLMKVYPVDVVGGCGTEACRPAETKKCYVRIANRYKFYLAFENAICQDYVTEKLFNPLEYYIIPVTLGGVNYSTITPSNSVINAMEFLSPEELGQYLWKVSRNETLYMSYFAWKAIFRSYLQPWMCYLCEKLHDPSSHRVNYDLETWWNEGNSCLRWTSEGFVPVKKHSFPKFNTKQFE